MAFPLNRCSDCVQCKQNGDYMKCNIDTILCVCSSDVAYKCDSFNVKLTATSFDIL